MEQDSNRAVATMKARAALSLNAVLVAGTAVFMAVIAAFTGIIFEALRLSSVRGTYDAAVSQVMVSGQASSPPMLPASQVAIAPASTVTPLVPSSPLTGAGGARQVAYDAPRGASAPVPGLSPATGSPLPLSLGAGPNQLVLQDKVLAQKVIAALGNLPSIDDGAAKDGRFIIAFFDPRCRYCHMSFEQLSGKLPIKWLPVSALGNPEEFNAKALGILAANDRLAALRANFSGSPMPAVENAASANKEELLNRTGGAFAEISNLLAGANIAGAWGAPTFVVPRPNGELVFYTGFEPTILQDLSQIFGAG